MSRQTEETEAISLSPYFYQDLTLQNSLFAMLIHSPIQNGTIRSITLPSEFKEVKIITAKDIPGETEIVFSSVHIPIFAWNKVSYVGEPIGLLLGSRKEILVEALKSIEIKYTLENPEAQNDNELDNTEKEVLAVRELGIGEYKKVFARSPIILEKSYSFSSNENSIYETQGAIADYSNKNLIVYTPTIESKNLIHTISSVLGINEKSIKIYKTKNNNENSNAFYLQTIFTCQTCVASFIAKRPVKLCLTRQEQKDYIDNSCFITAKYKTVLNPDGKIRASDIEINVDCGIYSVYAQEIVDRLTVAAFNCYTTSIIHIQTSAIKSNKPPLSIQNGRIDSAVFFFMENQIQEIARQLRLSPYEIRLLNLKENETSKPLFSYQNNSLKETLDIIFNKTDYERKNTAYLLENNLTTSKENYPIKGIGLSCGFEGNGFQNSDHFVSSNVTITMNIDGTITILTSPFSDNIKKIWNNIIIKLLDISENQIKYETDNLTNLDEKINETHKSIITIETRLLTKACQTLQKNRFRKPLPIKTTKKQSLNQAKEWDSEHFSGKPFVSLTFGTAIAEVEVIPFTYKIIIKYINVIINCGQVLNISQAEQSIKKSINQIILTMFPIASFNNDNLKLSFTNNTDEPNDLGEIMYKIIPSAISSAVSSAIKNEITTLPLTQEILYNSMNIKDDTKLAD